MIQTTHSRVSIYLLVSSSGSNGKSAALFSALFCCPLISLVLTCGFKQASIKDNCKQEAVTTVYSAEVTQVLLKDSWVNYGALYRMGLCFRGKAVVVPNYYYNL